QALDEPGDDQGGPVRADAADERREREHGQADKEHPSPADEISEASGEEEDAAEGDEVSVDDPGEARLAEAEVALDSRERDIHDRRIEHDHERPGAQDFTGEP